MCIDLAPWVGETADLTFGKLANVQTVGIGLYLALAVIQAVSTTGIAGLSRRVATLLTAVTSTKMRLETANVRRLAGDVSGLEIGFHDLNRRLLRIVFMLFTISVVYFGYCTIWQDVDAGQDGVMFIFGFYLVLPILIFTGSTLLIWRRCRAVTKRVDDAQKRIQDAMLGL